MSQHKLKRRFKASPKDAFEMADAVFTLADARKDRTGWVLMMAGPKGQTAINDAFINAGIGWRKDQVPGLPPDWRAFEINVPAVVSHPGVKHKLNLAAAEGADLSTATTAALSVLLAAATYRAGARAAILDGAKVEFLIPEVN